MSDFQNDPLRRSDPVGGSVPAMIVAAVSHGLISSGMLHNLTRYPFSILGSLLFLACYAVPFLLLVRAVMSTWRCRSRRSFQLVAEALRRQRLFWISQMLLMLVSLAAIVIFTL